MSHRATWFYLALGGAIYCAISIWFGFSTARGALDQLADALYWSGVALLWHWFENRGGRETDAETQPGKAGA